jgi:hypothetical protein
MWFLFIKCIFFLFASSQWSCIWCNLYIVNSCCLFLNFNVNIFDVMFSLSLTSIVLVSCFFYIPVKCSLYMFDLFRLNLSRRLSLILNSDDNNYTNSSNKNDYESRDSAVETSTIDSLAVKRICELVNECVGQRFTRRESTRRAVSRKSVK